ncbi:MAG TPA: D-inositol-3-phosphate glycosyltransferase [Pseudonocardiaceae bacterium]|jgi:D-inositol-3-phosphate glycosyltransferase|nr:D-inositol-3-phosphate glycosyltransferase [Pseudonocardiaceae bacterium]
MINEPDSLTGSRPHRLHRLDRSGGRVAVLSLHTSPLEQPGTGDAGGMNVYIVQTAQRMARRGVSVEIFTRATSSDLPPTVELADGVLVRHVTAGPFEGLDKNELPAQLCAFAAGVLRTEAQHSPGYYDIVHSHYWLSGQVGWLAKQRWGVPLVHTAHTLARVKNLALAKGDTPEPRTRVIGEQQVVDESDLLIANTNVEAEQLLRLYAAEPDQVLTVPPGVDLDVFTPGDQQADRAQLGIRPDALVFAFVGRIQPLKAPDVLVRGAAELLRRNPELRHRLVVLIVGGASGSGLERPRALVDLAAELGVLDQVRFLPPRRGAELAKVYRAADAVAVPSHNESFGLVALEAQACGTPVIAAKVGGLPVAVAHQKSGLLVPGHDAEQWAGALATVGLNPRLRDELAQGAVAHAGCFSWDRTTDALLEGYARAAVSFRRSVRELAGAEVAV